MAAHVAAIIVEYHSGEALARCLASLRRNSVDEIVVLDNGAPDQAALDSELSADVTLISARHNAGFGAGVNLGAARTAAELLVGLQSGRRHAGGCRRHPPARRCGRTREQLSSGRHCSTTPATSSNPPRGLPVPSAPPRFRPFSGCSGRPVAAAASTGPATGRSPSRHGRLGDGGLFPRAGRPVRALGGFDDEYFLYVEEVDFCWRLRAAGWEVLYQPEARVIHTGGVSTSAHPVSSDRHPSPVTVDVRQAHDVRNRPSRPAVHGGHAHFIALCIASRCTPPGSDQATGGAR